MCRRSKCVGVGEGGREDSRRDGEGVRREREVRK